MTAWIIILFSWYLFMVLAINLMAFLNVLLFRDLFLCPSNLLERIFLLEETRGLQKKLLSWLIEKGR